MRKVSCRKRQRACCGARSSLGRQIRTETLDGAHFGLALICVTCPPSRAPLTQRPLLAQPVAVHPAQYSRSPSPQRGKRSPAPARRVSRCWRCAWTAGRRFPASWISSNTARRVTRYKTLARRCDNVLSTESHVKAFSKLWMPHLVASASCTHGYDGSSAWDYVSGAKRCARLWSAKHILLPKMSGGKCV